MYKNYARSKRILLLPLLCLTIAFATNSCKKDHGKWEQLTKTEVIAEAKAFFDDEIANLPQLNDNNDRHQLGKTPLWDKAKIKKIKLGDAVYS